jgi:hypothetical protein
MEKHNGSNEIDVSILCVVSALGDATRPIPALRAKGDLSRGGCDACHTVCLKRRV